jgi:hypothetical protein
MNDPIDRKITWAAVFGICFIFCVVVQQTVLRLIPTLTPASDAAFYFIVLLWAVSQLPFFATLILNARGYIYLAEKYDHGILKLGAWMFSIAAAMMYVLIVAYGFQSGTHVDARLTNGLIGLVMFPYIAGLIVMELGSYSLRHRLGNIIFLPTGIGILLSLEMIVALFQALAGMGPSVFLGWIIFSPIQESLFAISSTILLFRSSGD